MNYAHLIRAIAGVGDEGSPLPGQEIRQLFAAMLEGGLPDLELGALLVAMGTGTLPQWALLGFDAALADNVLPLVPPVCDRDGARPVVIPAYGGARTQHNLTPLLALLLQRLRVPVLVHGTLEGHGRAATAYVFRELGIMPCLTLARAQSALDNEGLAFVPTGVLAPGLASLLSLRNRVGVTGVAPSMALLIDPFPGKSMRLVSAARGVELEMLRDLLLASGQDALVMAGTEGEAFANPRRRPRMELVSDGASLMLFDQEAPHDHVENDVAFDVSPRATAALIRQMLDAPASVPAPISHQLACCLFAAGHAQDFNQAKAIVAVHMRSLAAA